jgi:hypothetical protein
MLDAALVGRRWAPDEVMAVSGLSDPAATLSSHAWHAEIVRLLDLDRVNTGTSWTRRRAGPA